MLISSRNSYRGRNYARANVYPNSTAFAVLVGGVDLYATGRIDMTQSQPVTFTTVSRQRGQASIWMMLDTFDAYLPAEGQMVSIYIYGLRVYAGRVTDIKINQWQGETGWRSLTISAVTMEILFDSLTVLPPRVYVNKTAGFIFADIVTNVCAGVSIALAPDIAMGVVEPILVLSGDRVTDVFDRLAVDSTGIWGVDPQNLTIYFRLSETNVAPFTLRAVDMQHQPNYPETWDQTNTNVRNRQSIKASLAINPPSNVLFAGDGATKIFALPYLPNSIVAVNTTTSTQATGVCTFTGQPAPGDNTVLSGSILSARYTFVAVLDNTQPYQVLIGATVTASAQNLADAINANPELAGVTFSLPTPENALFNAGGVTSPGIQFPLWTKVPGSGAELSDITDSAAFSWGSVVDGTDGTTDANLTAGTDYTWPVV